MKQHEFEYVRKNLNEIKENQQLILNQINEIRNKLSNTPTEPQLWRMINTLSIFALMTTIIVFGGINFL